MSRRFRGLVASRSRREVRVTQRQGRRSRRAASDHRAEAEPRDATLAGTSPEVSPAAGDQCAHHARYDADEKHHQRKVSGAHAGQAACVTGRENDAKGEGIGEQADDGKED